jgi:hypothetical protein
MAAPSNLSDNLQRPAQHTQPSTATNAKPETPLLDANPPRKCKPVADGHLGDVAAVRPADRRFARYRSTGDSACSEAMPVASASQVVATVTSPPHVLEASEPGASQQRGRHPRRDIGRHRSTGPRPTRPTIRRSARSVQTSPQLPRPRRTPNAPTADAYPKASLSGVSRRRPSTVKA